jgi:Tol biopolymer transport system component
MPAAFSIDRFLNIRSAVAPSFSPDGRFVSFITNTTGLAQLWQVPVGGGWPVQLTFTSESVRGNFYNPRKFELIYSMDAGGNERTQLYLLRGVAGNTDHGLGDGWTMKDLSRQPKAIHTFGGWSNDGQRFAFSANRDETSRFDIYVQNPANLEARLVQKGPGGYYIAAGWSPDDRFLLVDRAESNANQDLYALDAVSGAARHATSLHTKGMPSTTARAGRATASMSTAPARPTAATCPAWPRLRWPRASWITSILRPMKWRKSPPRSTGVGWPGR